MKRELAGKVAVVGVGTTGYGKLPDYDAYDLGVWALKNALEDCALSFDDIDGLIINRIPDYQRFGEITGINPCYVMTTPGQGRFSGICIETAVAVILAGMAEVVALVYGNNGRSAGDHYGGASDAYGSGGAGLWFPYGMTSPGAFHALMMRPWMESWLVSVLRRTSSWPGWREWRLKMGSSWTNCCARPGQRFLPLGTWLRFVIRRWRNATRNRSLTTTRATWSRRASPAGRR